MATRILDDEAPAEPAPEPFVAPLEPPDEPFVPLFEAEPGDESTLADPKITAAQIVDDRAGVDRAMRQIKMQELVRIRVPKVFGPQVVVINGARFNVPCNVFLEVPRQVAEVLQESGRI